MIDYKAADFWLRFAQVIGYVLLGAWVYISNRQKATAREVKAIETKTVSEIKALESKIGQLEKTRNGSCSQHQSRTTALEVQIKQVPTHDHLGEIHEKINGVKGAVDRLSGLISGMNTNLAMLFEQHLEEGRKK